MNILAIETSQSAGSAAAARDDQLLLEIPLDPSIRNARSLAPALRRLLEQVAWLPREVDLVAVTIGPGSFTGLRVGVTTAKSFAYATGAQVLGVDTLEAVAARAPAGVESLAVAIDAQRGQLVGSRFSRDAAGQFTVEEAAALWDGQAWLEHLPAGMCVTGPVFRTLAGRVPAHLRLLEPAVWDPAAAGVAQVALRHWCAGRHDDIWGLSPRYSRPSAAEEKANASRRRVTE